MKRLYLRLILYFFCHLWCLTASHCLGALFHPHLSTPGPIHESIPPRAGLTLEQMVMGGASRTVRMWLPGSPGPNGYMSVSLCRQRCIAKKEAQRLPVLSSRQTPKVVRVPAKLKHTSDTDRLSRVHSSTNTRVMTGHLTAAIPLPVILTGVKMTLALPLHTFRL